MGTTYRLRFSKTGRVKYISHLDMIKVVQRALFRTKLPIAYSEGFHPHQQTAFPVNLSLGYTSYDELLEITLTEELPLEEVKERLNAVFPEGLHIHEAYFGGKKYNFLSYAIYNVKLTTENPKLLSEQLMEFLAQEEILIEKKGKRGMKQVDLKPMIELQRQEVDSDSLTLTLCLPTGSINNLNPALIVKALEEFSGISVKNAEYCRKLLLDEKKEKFF